MAQDAPPTATVVNAASLIRVTPETPSALVGFAMGDEQGRPDTAERWVLIRVVGPGLAAFGVAEPLARPAAVLHGLERTPTRLGYEHRVFAQVIYPDGTTPESRFRDALRRATARSGAFAVPIPAVDDPLPESHDLVDLLRLGPGAFTVQAFAEAPNDTGEALIEIYPLPADFDPQLAP